MRFLRLFPLLCLCTSTIVGAMEFDKVGHALDIHRNLKAETQKFEEAKASFEKFNEKIKNLSQKTEQRIRDSLTLSNEEARSKAYNLCKDDQQRSRLESLENQFLPLVNNTKHPSPFLSYGNTVIVGIGHLLYADVIKMKEISKGAYYPIMRDTHKRSMETQKIFMDSSEQKLASAITILSPEEYKKFESTLGLIQRITNATK